MDNMKRKEKIGVPTMQLHSSGPDLKPQGAISSRGEQKSTSRQSEKLPPSGGKNKVEPENSEQPEIKRRLSFKERREIKQNNDTQRKSTPSAPAAKAQPQPIKKPSLKDRRAQQKSDDQNVTSDKNSNSKRQTKQDQEEEQKKQSLADEIEIVQEANSDEEGSSSDDGQRLDRLLLDQSASSDQFDQDSKMALKAEQESSILTTAEPSMIIHDPKEEDNKWRMQRLIDVSLTDKLDGAQPLNFDTTGERLFIMFENMTLVEINTSTGKVVSQTDLLDFIGPELEEGEAPKARAFALFRDLNMLAVSTLQAVYLIDYENELKYS